MQLNNKVIIGIDLAAESENPTGPAIRRGKVIKTSLVYTDQEILENITCNKRTLIGIDAPLNLPKGEGLRKAEKEMIKRGYRIPPQKLPAM